MSGDPRPLEEAIRWRLLRERLCEAQNHRCAYCGVKFGAEFKHWTANLTQATIDHVIPRSREGTDAWENLVAACKRCNEKRKDEDAFLFFERKGWLSNRDRKLGTWLDRAIRKTEPLPWWKARERKMGRRSANAEKLSRRAQKGSMFAAARRARLAGEEAKRRGRPG
jgi:CRISPR/Cas system Type II protein with McrA/HNH and RuvC-like nuclease domain